MFKNSNEGGSYKLTNEIKNSSFIFNFHFNNLIYNILILLREIENLKFFFKKLLTFYSIYDIYNL